MKFIVTKDALNVVDVRLHWESKEKIRRIASWTAGGVIVVASVMFIASRHQKTSEEE